MQDDSIGILRIIIESCTLNLFEILIEIIYSMRKKGVSNYFTGDFCASKSESIRL